ncbi:MULTISPECIES: hypothetical protein [unclassified Lentimonas]|uniref:hypothetical protein n=1 Tax=unclassified Lentimonas TaxID=2630993 RepID=UPI00132106AE|nr:MULTISPECIES: hypothetical protein [unclassified Lentimonas]CAA6676450.1 Unannotated [Lentimonas sp. CC4]CAA6685289.1 Unannotated [Lentimonas sp. CC6]CAA7074986.1 Unannotated [Lentimonas sp. CC4]CAA7171032.1 Unannotated [Lentimonas sp. CC21]CAA7180628.1 Unannotated [Lentimonas sp. CC8]
MINPDDSHLDSLAIAHYVLGGLMALFACLPLMHVAMGAIFVFGVGEFSQEMANQPNGGPPPQWFGWLFIGIGLLFFALGQALSISVIVSGRFLKQRKNYMFSFVFACLACVAFPFGTILGVFTIIVLSRPSVKALYGRA